MARAALFAALIVVTPTLPEGCAKLLGKSKAAEPAAPPQPQPVVVTSATAPAVMTAPPIWTPPDPGGSPSTPASVAASSADLEAARALSEADEHKKVRALLEKKVKAGSASHEEASLLMESCLILRDKVCIEAIEAKHPDVEGP